MHELSIAQALREQVEPLIPRNGILQEVWLQIGQLEHIEDDTIKLAWQSTVMDHPTMGQSKLMIEHVSLLIHCKACDANYNPEEPANLFCPHCNMAQPEVLEGSGIILRTLIADVEEE